MTLSYLSKPWHAARISVPFTIINHPSMTLSPIYSSQVQLVFQLKLVTGLPQCLLSRNNSGMSTGCVPAAIDNVADMFF